MSNPTGTRNSSFTQHAMPTGHSEQRDHGEHSGHTGYRYGVFLRPDAPTSLAVTTATLAVRQQFGFISAGAFPPHATLAGHVVIARPDTASADDAVLTRMSALLPSITGFEVRNPGTVHRHHTTIAYDLSSDPRPGHADRPNIPLVRLAAAIDQALADIRNPDDPLPHPFSPENYRAHLSLASHDLKSRPDLTDEVEEFIQDLPLTPTRVFTAKTISAYRFHSPDWHGTWWRTMTWEHLRSWHLRPGG